VTLEDELERAASAASAHAGGGRAPAAVMPAELGDGARVYLAAFESERGLGYLALDAACVPVTDARVVRDAVSLIALAERAEEVSALIHAEAIAGRFEALADELAGPDPPAAGAAREVARAAHGVSGLAAGVRLATPAYLDRVGEAARELGAALDAYADAAQRLARPEGEGSTPGELGEAAWSALAQAAAAGDPAGFPQAMAAAADAVQALADDVVSNYLMPFPS